MKLLLCSDLHTDHSATQSLVDRSEDADVLICAGDLAVMRDGLQPVVDILSAAACPVVMVPGNGESDRELAAAIRRVMAGQRFVSNELAQLLALDPVDAEISPFELLSGREMQITLMVIRGMSAQEIGKKLALSPKTVNSYRYRVFEKLDLKNDVELTKLALKHDLLTEEVA